MGELYLYEVPDSNTNVNYWLYFGVSPCPSQLLVLNE